MIFFFVKLRVSRYLRFVNFTQIFLQEWSHVTGRWFHLAACLHWLFAWLQLYYTILNRTTDAGTFLHVLCHSFTLLFFTVQTIAGLPRSRSKPESFKQCMWNGYSQSTVMDDEDVGPSSPLVAYSIINYFLYIYSYEITSHILDNTFPSPL